MISVTILLLCTYIFFKLFFHILVSFYLESSQLLLMLDIDLFFVIILSVSMCFHLILFPDEISLSPPLRFSTYLQQDIAYIYHYCT